MNNWRPWRRWEKNNGQKLYKLKIINLHPSPKANGKKKSVKTYNQISQTRNNVKILKTEKTKILCKDKEMTHFSAKTIQKEDIFL